MTATETRALAVVHPRGVSAMEDLSAYLEEKRELIRSKYAYDAVTEIEFDLYIETCKLRQLNPIARQINCIQRSGKASYEPTIDGFRLIAARTGQFAGSEPYTFTYGDDLSHPETATCTVYRIVQGIRCAFSYTTYWDERAAYDKYGKLTLTWKTKGRNMLGKCAESGVLRQAFPEECGGLYVAEEMEQADNPVTVTAGYPFDLDVAQWRAMRDRAAAAGVGFADDVTPDGVARLIQSHAVALGERNVAVPTPVTRQWVWGALGTLRRLRDAAMATPPEDAIEGEVRDEPPAPPEPEHQPFMATDADTKALYTAATRRNIGHAEVHGMIAARWPDARNAGGDPSAKYLTREQIAALTTEIETRPLTVAVEPVAGAGPSPEDIVAFEAQERAIAAQGKF